MMREEDSMIVAFGAGVGLIVLVLWDAFETVILPRRVTRQYRLTRLFYKLTWVPWSRLASFAAGRRRETLFSIFGPFSLLALLTVWALGLVAGFAMLQWSLGSPLNPDIGPPGFTTYLYMSGTTFFTLGFGDVVPIGAAGRALAVLESGTGFGFLALVLGYLPVLYQAFSRREVNISLLDARAGSPPTAAELLRRHSGEDGRDALRQLLQEWERWSAELMESHVSYPVLAYFRSQHDNQSWLAALTAILDTSALVMASGDAACQKQGRLTFAIARHAVVDLAQVFGVPPRPPATERLPEDAWPHLARVIDPAPGDASAFRELSHLRNMYEPYVTALASHLRLSLPPWLPPAQKPDNWQTSAWGRAAARPAPTEDDEHS